MKMDKKFIFSLQSSKDGIIFIIVTLEVTFSELIILKSFFLLFRPELT